MTEVTREAVLEAIRARRSYAATDNILLDFRVEGAAVPRISAHIHGTGPLRKVEVIRNNQYIHSHAASGPAVDFTYVDNEPPVGEVYYYIRVEQADGQLAWSSPVWIQR